MAFDAILIGALVLLVLCGVASLVLLWRTFERDEERVKKVRDARTRTVSDQAGAPHSKATLESHGENLAEAELPQAKIRYEDSLRQLAQAQLATRETQREAREAIADAHREVKEAAAAVADLARTAAEAQAEAVADANRLVFEAFSQYHEWGHWLYNTSETEELESWPTQEDIDRWLNEDSRNRQPA